MPIYPILALLPLETNGIIPFFLEETSCFYLLLVLTKKKLMFHFQVLYIFKNFKLIYSFFCNQTNKVGNSLLTNYFFIY